MEMLRECERTIGFDGFFLWFLEGFCAIVREAERERERGITLQRFKNGDCAGKRKNGGRPTTCLVI